MRRWSSRVIFVTIAAWKWIGPLSAHSGFVTTLASTPAPRVIQTKHTCFRPTSFTSGTSKSECIYHLKYSEDLNTGNIRKMHIYKIGIEIISAISIVPTIWRSEPFKSWKSKCGFLAILACILLYHLNTEPFHKRSTFNHLNTRHVGYGDPHSAGIQIPDAIVKNYQSNSSSI